MNLEEEKISIVEFVGLPGCGKTTLCQFLSNNKLNGQFVLSSSVFIPKGFFNKLVSLFRDVTFSYLFALAYFILANNVNRKKRMFIYLIRLKMIYTRFFRDHQYDNTVLLVDQGLVQAIGSTFLGKECIKAKGLSLFLSHWRLFVPVLMLVYCNIPVEVSANRLTERNTMGGEFDKYRGDKLISAMKSHYQLMDELKIKLSNIGFYVKNIEINMLNTIEFNSNIIYQEIK